MQSIDINCDMGESTHLWPYHTNQDLDIFPYISSINIACGFHAGDPHTMHELVDAALQAGIAVGAHPGFADRENFGRTNMTISPVHLYDILVAQLGTLDAFLKINGTGIHHVKPHGALYNMAAADATMANMVCKAIYEYNPSLILYGLSGSELIKAAAALGLESCSEVFADRTYQPDGMLSARSQAGAVITDEEQSIQQVLQMVQRGSVTATDGKPLTVEAGTVCVHSDGVHARALAKRIYESLKERGIEIRTA